MRTQWSKNDATINDKNYCVAVEAYPSTAAFPVHSCSKAVSPSIDIMSGIFKNPFKGKDGGSAGESTPLAASSSNPTGQASSIFTSENAQKANQYAKEKAKELRIMAREGDFSIRLLALIGGVAMCIVSAFGFITTFTAFHGVSALVELYTFCLGVIIILLEGTKMPLINDRFRQNLSKYALFLKFVWGRGILYFIAGTLQLTQSGIADLIVGGYMCLVGIAYIYVGRKTAQKLRTLRQELFSPSQLRSKFDEADTDRTGSLTMGQFKVLTDNMGLDMNRREIEAGFMCMDKQDDGLLTFDEFSTWWNDWDDQGQHASDPIIV